MFSSPLLVEMLPALSQAKIADRRSTDSKVGCNGSQPFSGRPASANLCHLRRVQLGARAALTSRFRPISGLVAHVLLVRPPVQVSSVPTRGRVAFTVKCLGTREGFRPMKGRASQDVDRVASLLNNQHAVSTARVGVRPQLAVVGDDMQVRLEVGQGFARLGTSPNIAHVAPSQRPDPGAVSAAARIAYLTGGVC